MHTFILLCLIVDMLLAVTRPCHLDSPPTVDNNLVFSHTNIHSVNLLFVEAILLQQWK